MTVLLGIQSADTQPTTGSIAIEQRIVEACGHMPTAHFAFDSASIQGDAAQILDTLSDCFANGPLKGRMMRLVGHADPRGEPSYNLVLGQRRATNVAAYLEDHGVDAAQVTTMSKGDVEATGTDEESWALDRKVEVFLAD